MADARKIARSKAQERHRKLAQIRRERRTRAAIAAGAVLLMVVVVYWVYHSSLLNVTGIDIVGNRFVSSTQIAKLCNVTQETNLLSVPTGDIREKLLSNPWVKDATVKRALPHTLRIDVVERAPLAMLSHANKFFLIDENKVVVAERPSADGVDVPIITDLPVDKIKVGMHIANDSLDNAVKCLRAMDAPLLKTISLLSASSVDKLSLYNKDNIEILYGEAKQAQEKHKILQTILKQQGRQVVFVDIRSYPHSDPVIKRMDSVP